MLVKEFHRKHDCCEDGVAEGLQYGTMAEWWAATDHGEWMDFCLMVENGNNYQYPGDWAIEDGKHLWWDTGRKKFVIVSDPSADWIREHIKCPW